MIAQLLTQPILVAAPKAERRKLFQVLNAWIERAEGRRRLAVMDERALHDIGLGRCEALAEADKVFWRE